MTKQEHKLKSMLNYYEVDLGGKKDSNYFNMIHRKKSLKKFFFLGG